MPCSKCWSRSLRLEAKCGARRLDRVGDHPGDADVAALAAVLADPGRAKMVMALGDGRALAASTLASEAGVAPSTASAHLSTLVDAGLCGDERHGDSPGRCDAAGNEREPGDNADPNYRNAAPARRRHNMRGPLVGPVEYRASPQRPNQQTSSSTRNSEGNYRDNRY